MLEWRGGRSIAFNGTISAPTIGLLRRALDQLLGVCPEPGTLYPLSVTDESGIAYTAMVGIDGQIATKALSALAVSFSLQLFAPDPRRLGAAHTAMVVAGLTGSGGVTYPVTYPVSYGTAGTTGVTTLVNAGTAFADLVFTLFGPLTTPVIRNSTTGDALTYNGFIPSGSTVVIDTSTGSVLYQGSQNYRALLSAANWFTLPVNTPTVVALSTSQPADTGSLQVAWRDSYY